ncbi:MAG: AAA family ATPase [Firmicutes bacterium]|nr:AAA family ATPase [Bacillota bacterium]
MRLHRVHFRGFGRFLDRDFLLGEGFNLIEAPNEAGKSTLIQGLLALMYGGKKEGLQQRKKADWYEDYRPWQGTAYGGELDFSLGEKEYRLIRSLRWEEEHEQLVDRKTGRDLTPLFPMDRRKDRQLIPRLTGLSRSLFSRICCFSSSARAGDQEMLEKLQQLMGKEARVEPVLKKLKAEVDGIGVRATGQKPYALALAKRKHLREEVERKRAEYRQLQQARQELARLEAERDRLASRLRSARSQVQQVKEQKQAAQERAALLREQAYLQDHWQRGETIRKRLEALREEREAILPPVLLSPAEGESLREWLRRHSDLSETRKRLAEEIRQVDEELQRFQKKAGHLLALPLGSISRAQEQLRQAAELEGELAFPTPFPSSERQILGEDVARLRRLGTEREAVERQREALEGEWNRLHLAETAERRSAPVLRSGIWWAAAGISGFGSFFLLFEQPLISGLLLAASVAAAYQGTQRYRQPTGENRDRWETAASHFPYEETERTLEEVREEWRRIRDREREILERWRAASVADLFTLWQDQSADAERRGEIHRIHREVQEWAAPLKGRLGSFEPRRWQMELERIEEEAERARETRRTLEIRLAALRETLAEKEEEKGRIDQEGAAWRQQLGTEHPALWEEWIRNSNRVHELDRQIAEWTERMEEWERKRQEEDWECRKEKLEVKLDHAEKLLQEIKLPEDPAAAAKELADRLAEAEADSRRLEADYHQVKERVDRLTGELSQSGDLSLGDVETMLEEAEREVEELDRKRTILEEVRAGIEEAAREIQDDLAPWLRPQASTAIREVTGGRYGELMVNPAQDFAMRVFVPETGVSQPVEQLSRGTIDQMYFALRLALIRFFSDHASLFLPLILDDSLVHFDEDRLRQAIRILGSLSRSHQVILCTCQDRERRMLEDEGIPFTRMRLDLS